MNTNLQRWISRLWSVLLTLCICLMLLAFSSCSSSEVEPQADPKEKLYATWTLGTKSYLKKDGINVTANYPGFEVSFSAAGTYTSKNAGIVFKPNGTFSWNGEEASAFTRDGEIPTQVTLTEDGSLRMQFQLNAGNLSGRQAATTGTWEIFIELKK